MSEKRKGAIPIAAAKKVSHEHGCPIVLIFGIEADGCHYTVTTYGRTKPLCAWAAKLSSDIQQAVMAGKVLGDVEHAHNPYELIATLRHERDEARASYDALRITSETTIGQLRQQAKHLEDRAKELETENEKLKTVRTKLQGKLRPQLSNIPQGYQRLSAYTNGTEVIVTGPPPSEDDDPECEIHNCDQMGCNWEHALLRQEVNWFWLGNRAAAEAVRREPT